MRLRLCTLWGHKVGKTESRSKIVAKAQQSFLTKVTEQKFAPFSV